MKADIVCVVCEAILGSLSKKIINDRDIERYQNTCTCDCGGSVTLVITEQ
jgi:hypothetical protein